MVSKGSYRAWALSEDHFQVEDNLIRETLLAVANGHIGLRAAHEEGFAGFGKHSQDGTFINGFYDSAPIHYPEISYGLAKEQQFIVNVPNAKCINFSLDGEEFDLFQGNIKRYDRSLDFRTGILQRNVEWTSANGKTVRVTSKRIVPFGRRNLFAIEYIIQSIDFAGWLTLRSAVQTPIAKSEQTNDPRFDAASLGQPLQELDAQQDADLSAFLHRTANSGLLIATAIDNDLTWQPECEISRELLCQDRRLEQLYRTEITPGSIVRLRKYAAYVTSVDQPKEELLSLAKAAVGEAKQVGFASLCSEQKEFLTKFWQHADIQIIGDDALQQGIHFNRFHVLQAAGRDGRAGVPAKGLTGDGYDGHYFWDAETYALPLCLYSEPEVARELLHYRYTCLDKARTRAREMSHAKGALFPWRTINGNECSAFFPAGTAQYHINADIAYAIKLYQEATGDDDFIRKFGAEIVMDTARIWMGIGNYANDKSNRFYINEVTGPDEYEALVDNNLFTNAMAQMHLRYAADLADELKRSSTEDFRRIKNIIGLADDEPSQWRRAADSMYLPYDTHLGIHPQDDSFLSKAPWLAKDVPADKRPLLLHYHYLRIYRHQICKQADVLMALFLLGDRFSMKDKKRDYDYYEPITTHDSSLSPSIFSIIAAEVGYGDRAYKYFADSARRDLDGRSDETTHGVHIAAMAGTWMSVVYGFAGMRTYDGNLSFSPTLPTEWESYEFRLWFKSRLLSVSVSKQQVRYQLLSGQDLRLHHRNAPIQVSRSAPVKVVPLSFPQVA
ncbi:MAG TPA: glycosyl hydrolase family 65 protein [Candidatus Obscuribacterales bacterium]